jgi:predicted nucleic acid-binding protein
MTAGNVIIDTGILTLYFAGDERLLLFFGDIERKRRIGYLTAVNLSEFFYKTCESLGEEVAELRFHQCRELLKIFETNEELALDAGKAKCHRHGNLSLSDCFAIAATKILNGTLLTTDPELAETKAVDVRLFRVE